MSISLFIITSCTSAIESVENRATARWKALIASDFQKAYTYETPSYRKSYSFQRYLGNFGGEVKWTDVEVESLKKIQDELSEVTLRIKVEFEGLPIETTSKERWVLKDKQWWHVQE